MRIGDTQEQAELDFMGACACVVFLVCTRGVMALPAVEERAGPLLQRVPGKWSCVSRARPHSLPSEFSG